MQSEIIFKHGVFSVMMLSLESKWNHSRKHFNYGSFILAGCESDYISLVPSDTHHPFPSFYSHAAEGAYVVCQPSCYSQIYSVIQQHGCLHRDFKHNDVWHNSILQPSTPVCHPAQKESVNIKCSPCWHIHNHSRFYKLLEKDMI